jgi:8-oxo-dGTP pyrophosphatase MutT (NUDIX family)
MTEKCSGILFITKDGKGLFLKRADNYGPKQYRGLWGLPGGHLKDGETHEQAAIRETIEETGERPKGKLFEINRQVTKMVGDDEELSAEIDYLTYAQILEHEYIPKLNKEHTEFIWAPLGSPPDPIHPGLAITIKKLTADELEIAEMILRGDISSPQKYMNIWLFDIRVTGTGLSYRSGLDEYVWRDNSLYLNERFLKRCQGLPIVFEHPKSATLNTKEYVERNIGSVFLPYIKGDEVWAIVKIWDDFAARIMKENILSTSPAVVLTGNDKYFKTNDDGVLLVEGKPKLLDHLAICQAGVWDKSGPPKGISAVTTGDLVMADEDDKAAALEAARKTDALKVSVDAAEKAKADAAAKAKKDADESEFKASGGGGGSGELIDKTLKCLDSISSRMDAFEASEKEREAKRADKKARKDARRAQKDSTEAQKADQAKKDAEEKAKKDAEEKSKADAKAKADAETEVRKRIADVEARLPKQMTDADYSAVADTQARADRICLMHGSRASRPLDGETHFAYRRRLATGLKDHSPAWKNIDLALITDEAAFTNIERTIYADAENAGLHPVAPAEDYLREIINEDVTGRKISTFVGRPSAWMNQFAPNRRRLIGIRNH